MTKDKLFARLAGFLKRNVQMVADARDSNAPWYLLEQLNEYEFYARRRKGLRKKKKAA